MHFRSSPSSHLSLVLLVRSGSLSSTLILAFLGVLLSLNLSPRSERVVELHGATCPVLSHRWLEETVKAGVLQPTGTYGFARGRVFSCLASLALPLSLFCSTRVDFAMRSKHSYQTPRSGPRSLFPRLPYLSLLLLLPRRCLLFPSSLWRRSRCPRLESPDLLELSLWYERR
jgi:hypothetical protein